MTFLARMHYDEVETKFIRLITASPHHLVNQ